MARLLLVEGDPSLRTNLASTLSEAGHEVEAASSARAALALARTSRPDIVLFDLLLPDMSGIELCKALRADGSRRPSLFVLTSAHGEADRVAAFEAGADDYVTKPPSMREIVLRVRALSRRRSVQTPANDRLTVGALRIDREARRADVAGSEVDLTRREFDLLVHLADRAGRVQTRDMLVADVWGEITDTGRVVDTTIKRLRKKLRRTGAVAPEIRTVRGVGYKLVEVLGGVEDVDD